MAYYITPAGQYYTGKQRDPLDTEVPERPALTYRWNGEEWVSEKVAFNSASDYNRLLVYDLSMSRVLEDLISVLIAKGTITIDDLPADARDKIAAREALRETL